MKRTDDRRDRNRLVKMKQDAVQRKIDKRVN